MTPTGPQDKQDVLTPEWSQALAEVCQSPMWRGLKGMERKAAFVDEASTYPGYDAMPPRLQAIYQRAYRQLHGQRGTHGRSRH